MNQQYDPNKPAVEQPGQDQRQQPGQDQRQQPRPDQSGGADRSQDRQDGGTSQPRRTDVEREERLPKEDE